MPYDESGFAGQQAGSAISDFLVNFTHGRELKRQRKRQSLADSIAEANYQKSLSAAQRQTSLDQKAQELSDLIISGAAPESYKPQFESFLLAKDPATLYKQQYPNPKEADQHKQAKEKILNDWGLIWQAYGNDSGGLHAAAIPKADAVIRQMQGIDPNLAREMGFQLRPDTRYKAEPTTDELIAKERQKRQIKESVPKEVTITGADVLKAKRELGEERAKPILRNPPSTEKKSFFGLRTTMESPIKKSLQSGGDEAKYVKDSIVTAETAKVPEQEAIARARMKKTPFGTVKTGDINKDLRAEWHNKDIDSFGSYQDGYDWLQSVRSALNQQEYEKSVHALKEKFPRGK